MAKVNSIPECGVNFSDTLSACDTCKIIKSTLQKHRKTPRPNLSSERIKLVSTDLLGYAYMAQYTDHHSRVNASSFIEEACSRTTNSRLGHFTSKSASAGPITPRISETAVRCRFAVHQGCRNGQNKPSGICFGTQHLRATYGLTTSGRMQTSSARRSTTSARRTPSKLQHLEVATTAPARKTAFDHRDCLVNYLRQPL